MNAERFGPIAQEAGADLFFVQSTVATVRHIASKYKVVDLAKLIKGLKIPVIVGNTVSYAATLELLAPEAVTAWQPHLPAWVPASVAGRQRVLTGARIGHAKRQMAIAIGRLFNRVQMPKVAQTPAATAAVREP